MEIFSRSAVFALLTTGLVACGGGGGSSPVATSDPVRDPRDLTPYCAPASVSLLSAESNERWENMKRAACATSETLDGSNLTGLWAVFSNVDITAITSDGNNVHEQIRALKVFQINELESEPDSNGVTPNNIEIKDCSSGFWDSGEVVNLDATENSYSGSNGTFLMAETDVLPISLSSLTSKAVSVSVVNNRKLSISSYPVKTDNSSAGSGIAYASAAGVGSNVVAYKVDATADRGIGSITNGTETNDIQCMLMAFSAVEQVDSGIILAGEEGIKAEYVNAATEKKDKLLIFSSTNQAMVNTLGAQLLVSQVEGDSSEELFSADSIQYDINENISASGSLGANLNFEIGLN